MKKRILIISGGISKERAISLDTGNQVAKELKKKYSVKVCEPDHNLEKEIKYYLNTFKDHPYIFNLGHGIKPETKIEMVDILVNTVREFK